MDRQPIEIELLAPARDADVAIEAIKHGADAVYIGGPGHGARAAAVNAVSDIARAVEFAHRFGARVYVTVNTLVYEDEIARVEALIRQLYDIGVDALIVQDLGILRMNIPPIALHASTQCDSRTPRKAQFLEQVGFSQIVLPRELTLDEIGAMRRATKVPLEAFVHGALCVCYSGDCRASLLATGRSANRGECAQVCRYQFDLYDVDGRALIKGKYLLSLRDLNRSAEVAAMMEVGVSSFKIEGRLKDASYVKNITAYYRQVIDGIIAANPERYCRSSIGQTVLKFAPDPARSFNRGFTSYFINGAASGSERHGVNASVDTPKSTGPVVAKVKGLRGKALLVDAIDDLHNGDGLGYFDSDGHFNGFRLNRVEHGYLLFPATPLRLKPGTLLYRNRDKAFDDLMASDTASRSIAVEMTVRYVGGPKMLVIDAHDERGCSVSVTARDVDASQARSPQTEARRKVLEKTGGTIYRVVAVNDQCGDLFIPLSALTALRREALEALDRAQRITYSYDYRRREDVGAHWEKHLTFHDNVANSLARKFYTDHGAESIERAAEEALPARQGMEVMATRYCLRGEMGCCLMTPAGKKWKGPLTMVSGPNRYVLDFDCRNCMMRVKVADGRQAGSY